MERAAKIKDCKGDANFKRAHNQMIKGPNINHFLYLKRYNTLEVPFY
jgi:hypothetical protein